MTRSVTLSLMFVSAFTLALLALVAAPSARAAEPESAFAFDAGTQAALLTTPEYTFSTECCWYGEYPHLEIDGPGGLWKINANGPYGAKLEAGRTYYNASTWQSDGPWPFFKIHWHGACTPACLDGGGWFTVHDVAYDQDDKLTLLSMTFDNECSATRTSHGEIRYNTTAPAYPALSQQPFCTPNGDRFPDTYVGETSGPLEYSVTNLGVSPVTFGSSYFDGDNPEDVVMVADTCSDSVLGVGGTCDVSANYAPKERGNRGSTLIIPSDTGSGMRKFTFWGYAIERTTLVLDAPTGTAYSPVTLSATLTGPANGGVGFMFPDEPTRNQYINTDVNGSASATFYLPPGDYPVYAWYSGNDDYEEAVTPTVTLHVGASTPTGLTLTSSVNPVLTTERTTITATLVPDSGIDGGTLKIYDDRTGATLGTTPVAPGSHSLTVTPMFTEPGGHEIYAKFSGHEQWASVHAELQQSVELDEDIDTDFTIKPPTFYPHIDGYRDDTRITITRAEPLSADIEIRAEADGAVVYTASHPVGQSDIAFDWDGRDGAGQLVPQGYYLVRATFTDPQPNTVVVERRLILSHDYIDWTTRTVTLDAGKYSLVGTTRDGFVSRAKAKYSGGVRLGTGKGSASVVYTFPVKSSLIYRDMTFSALGKSKSGHHAIVSIWNPDLGGYKYLANYDAAQEWGPAYGWWKTSADGARRVSGGKVRTAVSTWNGLGKSGSGIVDLKDVRLTYETGALVRVAGPIIAGAAAEADLLADYRADAHRGRVGSTVRSLHPGNKIPRMHRPDKAPTLPDPDRAQRAGKVERSPIATLPPGRTRMPTETEEPRPRRAADPGVDAEAATVPDQASESSSPLPVPVES